jgi:hypothetical protein
MLLVGKDKDRLFVLEEFYKCDPSLNTLRTVIKGMYDKYPGITLLYDPSAKILFNDLTNIGITLKKANNDVAVGINRIRTKLEVRNDQADIVIHPRCVNLIREFENYQYKPNSEVVKKINDDLLDPLRYICNEVDDEKGTTKPFIMDYESADNEAEEELEQMH